jgi:hypothetical protein
MRHLRQSRKGSLLLSRMPQHRQVSANTRTQAAKRSRLRMQILRQANTPGKATTSSAGQAERGTFLIRIRIFGSQKLVRAVSATLAVKVLRMAAHGSWRGHINLWGTQAKRSRRNHELRREIGANPGNAGVRPGATGLIFRRGVSAARSAVQAQSRKRAPSPERSDGEGGGRGVSPRSARPMRPGAVCRAVELLPLHLTEV